MFDKVLRTLPIKYDSNVSTLEERDDLKLMTVDELHGIFNAYGMRTRQNGSSKKEAKCVYEGAPKVKESKFQTYKG